MFWAMASLFCILLVHILASLRLTSDVAPAVLQVMFGDRKSSVSSTMTNLYIAKILGVTVSSSIMQYAMDYYDRISFLSAQNGLAITCHSALCVEQERSDHMKLETAILLRLLVLFSEEVERT